MRFPYKYLRQENVSEIFYGVFWKNCSARVCASSCVEANTVTMATLPTISRSNGTAPVNLNSSGTGTRTTNCFSPRMRSSTCLIVSVTLVPVSACYLKFFNAGAYKWPCMRSHQPCHCTVNKPFKFDHAMRPITAYINESIRCSYGCPCLRR